MPQLIQTFPAQLWLNKLLLFFVIYFYLKEFVSLSQKLDNYTINSSKVHRVTLMVQSSLGIPSIPKSIKGGGGEVKEKNTQNKLKTHDDVGGKLLVAVSIFFHCWLPTDVSRTHVQFNLNKPFIPIPAP